MNLQRILLALVVLLAAGLAGAFYVNWKTLGQLRSVKAFVEAQVLADAVAACEQAQSSTPFKWTGAKQTAMIGVTSVKLNKDTIIPSYTQGAGLDREPRHGQPVRKALARPVSCAAAAGCADPRYRLRIRGADGRLPDRAWASRGWR